MKKSAVDLKILLSIIVGAIVAAPLIILVSVLSPFINGVSPAGERLFGIFGMERLWSPAMSVPLALVILWCIGRLSLAAWFRDTIGRKVLEKIPFASLLWKLALGVADGIERMRMGIPVLVYQYGKETAPRYRFGFMIKEVTVQAEDGDFPHPHCLLIVFPSPLIVGADPYFVPLDTDVWVIQNIRFHELLFAVMSGGFAFPADLPVISWKKWKERGNHPL